MGVSSYLRRIQIRNTAGMLQPLGSATQFGGRTLGLPHGAAELTRQAGAPGGVLSDEQYQRMLAAAVTQQAQQERQGGRVSEAARAGVSSALGALASSDLATQGARARGGTASEVAQEQADSKFAALQGLANALASYEQRRNELAIFDAYRKEADDAREFREYIEPRIAVFAPAKGLATYAGTKAFTKSETPQGQVDGEVPYYIRRPEEGDRAFSSYDPRDDDPLYYIRRPSSGSSSRSFSGGSSRGSE